MISQNEFCGAEQISTSYLRCLLYLLEEWTGVERLEEYLNYLITCLLVPLFIALLFPAVTFILVFICAITVHIYKRKTDTQGYMNDFWDGVRQFLATVWYVHARIWNGYEVHGLEKLPDGPALIIHYHGATFLDILYLSVFIFIRKKKLLHVVADRFIFSIPGVKLVSDVLQFMPGSQEECRKVLENGELLIISPGGVREALFSDENYTIIWRNRKGFAQVAIDAKVPIIPTFTQNIRENIRIIGGQIKLLRLIYEYLRLPIFPLYGNFPVKLQAYFGDPIPYDPNITAEELAKKMKNALRCLIDKHQKIPGNVRRALMERVATEKQDNE
ncbi:transmembrane protein 68-like [Notechis scutatus]|uniref:Transmembrane protein 68-like n=1 Tax=Notechis scutatus TaxID=8663 RepID=A0A6J1U7A3_9SAUR|nr:transmembrane protein 68-like [Notechis scutatus]